jgi:hypothetical protein
MAAKVLGTIRITPNAGDGASVKPHFEVVFLPYAGRMNTQTVRVNTHEELVSFLMEIRIPEDEASRWAGRARGEGSVLISGVERTEAQLKDSGLLA